MITRHYSGASIPYLVIIFSKLSDHVSKTFVTVQHRLFRDRKYDEKDDAVITILDLTVLQHTSVSNSVFTTSHDCFVCYRWFDIYSLLKMMNKYDKQ